MDLIRLLLGSDFAMFVFSHVSHTPFLTISFCSESFSLGGPECPKKLLLSKVPVWASSPFRQRKKLSVHLSPCRVCVQAFAVFFFCHFVRRTVFARVLVCVFATVQVTRYSLLDTGCSRTQILACVGSGPRRNEIVRI